MGITSLLYGAGVLFLCHFFRYGDVRLFADDWMKEHMYLNTLRDALKTREIPWHWSEAYYHRTNKFLANPEIIFTPHIVLLRWLPNSSFVIAHLIAFYSIGFLGCAKLAARLRFGAVPFFLLCLLFNLNGFITAHLGVGHLQWAGYYVLPVFLLLFTRMCEQAQQSPWRFSVTSAHCSLLMFLLILNGSFHIAIWCMLFMLIAIFWNFRLFMNVSLTLGLSVLLGLFRLLPAALYFPKSPSFTSGYPSLPIFLDALTRIRGRNFGALGGFFGQLMWWEYTIHIGFVALLLLAGGLIVTLKRKGVPLPPPMIAASLTLFVLSLGDVYALIPASGLPFSTVQRVSTRFIAIPLLVFFTVAIRGLDLMFKKGHIAWKKTVLLAIPFIMFELLSHVGNWNVAHLEKMHRPVKTPPLTLLGNPSQAYRKTIEFSWTVSKTTLTFLLLGLVVFPRCSGCERLMKRWRQRSDAFPVSGE